LLAEINASGDTLWTRLIPDVDAAPNTMVIANDTITVTGNNDPFNTAFRMAHFSLDGEKLGETIEIEHPERKFIRMFQLTTQYFNGKYAICGVGWEGDTTWSLIYIVDKDGTIDTLITVEPTDWESDLWDSFVDNEGRLTTYHWFEYKDSPMNYRKIYKFDTNYDTVWTYRSENSVDNDVIPYGCELQDGRTILSYTNPQQISYIHSVRAINPDGTKSWQHNYSISPYRGRNILRLKTLRNGDIVGCGNYRESQFEPIVKESPWLFRMSPDGELLWEHTYYEPDTVDDESRKGTLFDFIELSDGDILAVGYFQYKNNDMLVMRVDSNGCLDPAECEEVVYINTLTSTGELSLPVGQVALYPTPALDLLNIKFETNTYLLDVEIIDVNGRVIKSDVLMDGQGQIPTGSLPDGVYIAMLRDRGDILAVGHFVKM
jgi:hypothetical protein